MGDVLAEYYWGCCDGGWARGEDCVCALGGTGLLGRCCAGICVGDGEEGGD